MNQKYKENPRRNRMTVFLLLSGTIVILLNIIVSFSMYHNGFSFADFAFIISFILLSGILLLPVFWRYYGRSRRDKTEWKKGSEAISGIIFFLFVSCLIFASLGMISSGEWIYGIAFGVFTFLEGLVIVVELDEYLKS